MQFDKNRLIRQTMWGGMKSIDMYDVSALYKEKMVFQLFCRAEVPPAYLALCVFCVFFPFILDIKFAGRTGRVHTGFFVHLSSAVRALIFLTRRIQPFLSLVDREVECCVLTIYQPFSTCWAFLLLLFFICLV